LIAGDYRKDAVVILLKQACLMGHSSDCGFAHIYEIAWPHKKIEIFVYF